MRRVHWSPVKGEKVSGLLLALPKRSFVHRSLGLVYEAERAGQATTVELGRQGEQLQHVNSQLDGINSDIKQSEKHLRAIKSVFGAMRNHFGGGVSGGATVAASPRKATSESIADSAPFKDDDFRCSSYYLLAFH